MFGPLAFLGGLGLGIFGFGYNGVQSYKQQAHACAVRQGINDHRYPKNTDPEMFERVKKRYDEICTTGRNVWNKSWHEYYSTTGTWDIQFREEAARKCWLEDDLKFNEIPYTIAITSAVTGYYKCFQKHMHDMWMSKDPKTAWKKVDAMKMQYGEYWGIG